MPSGAQISTPIFDVNLPAVVRAFLIAGIVAAITLAAPAAQGQSFMLLHTFSGVDGNQPFAGLTMDRAGSLYGTTYEGGSGFGNVFKLSHHGAGWILSSLYNFRGGSDANGNLYGTTSLGGNFDPPCGEGCGVVWEITP